MKQFVIICGLLATVLISACSHPESQVQSDVDTPASKVESPVIEVETHDVDEIPEKLIESTDSEIIDESILSYSDYQRAEFEKTPYLTFGDKVAVFKDGVEIGTVSLEDYEVIEDSNGSGRKGVVFFFNEINTGTSTLELGMYSPNWLVQTHVFYENIYLDEMSYNAGTQQIIAYPKYDNTMICQALATLDPGESRTCYQFYSYVDDGIYLISQSTDLSEYESWSSYLVNIESD